MTRMLVWYHYLAAAATGYFWNKGSLQNLSVVANDTHK